MKQQLVDLKARDINKLLGTGADPQLTAENSEEEKEVTVSFFCDGETFRPNNNRPQRLC